MNFLYMVHVRPWWMGQELLFFMAHWAAGRPVLLVRPVGQHVTYLAILWKVNLIMDNT